MRFLITSFSIMAITVLTEAQNGVASTTKKTFSRSTSVKIEIKADPEIIWALLTNGSDYSRWNSTIVSLTGDLTKGSKIELKSTLDLERTFKLKVKEMIPPLKMIWGDAMGKRTYTLIPKTQGFTIFSMNEKIGGLMFPLFANKIPSFDKSFEQFAADLKKEAEAISNTK